MAKVNTLRKRFDSQRHTFDKRISIHLIKAKFLNYEKHYGVSGRRIREILKRTEGKWNSIEIKVTSGFAREYRLNR